jgi:glycosyltransferase involved in cell wall biosynthesis|tara:strand:- start:11067 stop:11996 length:930 start_codon:yes stop_codon:yes gene_type:complete
MSLISIVIPCFNEDENVVEITSKIKSIFKEELPEDKYEIIFIDNGSADKTQEKIKAICKSDKGVKLIINAKNYGQLISPYYGFLQANGDAVIQMVCDFQDPPDFIPQLVKKWKNGSMMVLGVPQNTKQGFTFLKKIFYSFINFFASNKQIPNFHGFGIYDKEVQRVLKDINDKYPYMRGQLLELNFEKEIVYYTAPDRKTGKSSNNFFSLYSIAIEGIVSTSVLPFKLISFIGLLATIGSILIILAKLMGSFFIFFYLFTFDLSSFSLSMLFFSSVQLLFLGLIGEYLLVNQVKNQNMPLVVEKERVNF